MSVKYAVVNEADGLVLRSGECPEEDVALQAKEGQAAVIHTQRLILAGTIYDFETSIFNPPE